METAASQENLGAAIDVTHELPLRASTHELPQHASARAADERIAQGTAEMRAALSKGIVLGGRTWFPMRAPTFELQKLRADVVRRAGIAPLFPTFEIESDDADMLAANVIDTAFAHGALFDLLAHLLVEDGTTWTPALAHENALRFASLTEPDDQARLSASVLWLVLDFFLSLANSTPIFLRSLFPRASASARRNTARRGDSAATTTSGAGTTS